MAEFNNRETVTFGGEQYELVASNGACVIYAEQFANTEGVSGRLKQDIIDLYDTHAKIHGYNPEDGKPVDGVPHRMVDYEDVPSIVGIVWAMARAAGSTKLGYAKFRERFMEGASSYLECDALFESLVFGLAQRAFFRDLDGQADAEQPNEG